MLFFTGDIHGKHDIDKLCSENWRFGQTLTKDDYLIICGDFGCVWANDKTDKELQNWLAAQPWTTLFVDGNHENHTLLKNYPVEIWKGGKIHKINDSIYHLMRGQIYDIAGYKILTYGGAYSTDRCHRTEGVSWWKDEVPTKWEEKEAIDNLNRHNNEVDIIVTHDIPNTVETELWFLPKRKLSGSFEKVYGANHVNPRETYKYFEENIDFKYWFMGHMHEDWKVEKDDKIYYLLFDYVFGLNEKEENSHFVYICFINLFCIFGRK